MTLTATVFQTEEVRLAPALRSKLLRRLRAYGERHAQIKSLEKLQTTDKAAIEVLRDEVGVQSVALEGFTVTLVAGVRQKFNKKLFVSLGGDLAIYEQAMENVPVKAYTKVTCPGTEKEEDE